MADISTHPEYIIAVILFMIGHLGAAIWFASKMNSSVSDLGKNLGQLAADVKALSTIDIRVAVQDQRILANEQRIRDLRDMVVKGGRE